MFSADLFEVTLECVIMYRGFFCYPGDLLFQPFWEAACPAPRRLWIQGDGHYTFDGARESPAREDPWLVVT